LCLGDAFQASQPLVEAERSGRARRAVDTDGQVFHVGPGRPDNG
jgi:hypothetical protein